MSGTPRSEEEIVPERLVAYLRDTARRGELATYGEIAPLLGIETGNEFFGFHVGRHLDALNRQEDKEDRPLLSAIVVNASTGQPGPGYYTCARDLRGYRGDDFEAWVAEVTRVHEYWKHR